MGSPWQKFLDMTDFFMNDQSFSEIWRQDNKTMSVTFDAGGLLTVAQRVNGVVVGSCTIDMEQGESRPKTEVNFFTNLENEPALPHNTTTYETVTFTRIPQRIGARDLKWNLKFNCPIPKKKLSRDLLTV